MRILTAMMCVLLAACTTDNKALIMKHRLACEAVYNNNGYLICNNKNGPGYIVWDSERIVGQFDNNSLSQVKSDLDSGTVQKYTNFYEYRLGKQLSATPTQVKELWNLKIYSVFEYENQSNAMSPRPKNLEEFLLYKRRAVEKAALEKTAQEKIATERAAAERIRRNQEFAKKFPYTAVLSCSIGGSGIVTLIACFSGSHNVNTQLEVRRGSFYRMYQYWEVLQAGEQTAQGIEIPLESQFSINAQNASESLLLNLKIVKTSTGEVLYQKSAARWGNVSARN